MRQEIIVGHSSNTLFDLHEQCYRIKKEKFNQFFKQAKQELIAIPFFFPDSALKAVQLGKELDELIMSILMHIKKISKVILHDEKANILGRLKKEYSDVIHFSNREEAQAYRACVVLLADASVQLNDGTAKSDFLCKAAQRDAITMENFLAITTDCFDEINALDNAHRLKIDHKMKIKRDQLEQLPEKYNPLSKKNSCAMSKYIFTVSERHAAYIYDQIERLDQLNCYNAYAKNRIKSIQVAFGQGILTCKTLKDLHEIERAIFCESIHDTVNITNKQLFIRELDLLLKSLLHSHFDCNIRLFKLMRLFHIVESAHILREERGFFRVFSSHGHTRSYQNAITMIKEAIVNVLEKTGPGDLTSESMYIAKKILCVHRGRGPHFFATTSEKKEQLMKHENFCVENKTNNAHV